CMKTDLKFQARNILLALATLILGATTPAIAEEAAPVEGGARAMAMEIVAVVTDVDLETRQVSLQGPTGNIITLHASEQVVKLEDVSVGDELVVTYLAALEGEIREPTEEELAEPWVVLEEGAVSEDPANPAVGGARAVRAVVTIEGLNRALGTVTVKDARGKLHLIADVEPEKIENATIGQTAVLVFTEALILSLERQSAAAE
ncbi:MAG: hypothetical protein ACPG1A_15370, partial [Halioglobus sp.]